MGGESFFYEVSKHLTNDLGLSVIVSVKHLLSCFHKIGSK